MNNNVSLTDVVLLRDGGGFYQIKGNLVNGNLVAEVALGAVSPNLYEITRRITSIDLDKKKLYCECGRVFSVDKDLTLVKCNY